MREGDFDCYLRLGGRDMNHSVWEARHAPLLLYYILPVLLVVVVLGR